MKETKFSIPLHDIDLLVEQIKKYEAQESETEDSRLNILGIWELLVGDMESRMADWREEEEEEEEEE